MHNDTRDKASHLLFLIAQSLETICQRCENICTVNDFLDSPQGMSLLDGVCMKLIAIGESIKNLDKLTDKQLLVNYPQIPWREVMGMRDIIVPHYFEVDADVILKTIHENVPLLLDVIRQIEKDLTKGNIQDDK